MNIVSAFVLYAVIWFLTLFVILPIGLRTQEEDGDVVPGTHPGSPADFRFGRMFLIVTIVATAIFAIIAAIIISGVITLSDLGLR